VRRALRLVRWCGAAEFVVELVPQLQYSWWQAIEGRLAGPRFYDLEQYLLPGWLKPDRASGADRLERKPDLEALSVLVDALE
jgi:hypothetical protein